MRLGRDRRQWRREGGGSCADGGAEGCAIGYHGSAWLAVIVCAVSGNSLRRGQREVRGIEDISAWLRCSRDAGAGGAAAAPRRLPLRLPSPTVS